MICAELSSEAVKSSLFVEMTSVQVIRAIEQAVDLPSRKVGAVALPPSLSPNTKVWLRCLLKAQRPLPPVPGFRSHPRRIRCLCGLLQVFAVPGCFPGPQDQWLWPARWDRLHARRIDSRQQGRFDPSPAQNDGSGVLSGHRWSHQL